MYGESYTALDVEKSGYFGLDIGGTLVKIVFYEKYNDPKTKTIKEFIHKSTEYGSTGKRDYDLCITTEAGKFHFILFETRRMSNAIELILAGVDVTSLGTISATGGGAYKFEELFKSAQGLGVNINKKDEIRCLMKGLDYLLRRVEGEVYYFEPDPTTLKYNTKNKVIHTIDEVELYPFLLVNVGTGVSIVFVKGPDDFERVSGSGLGGGTYCGLTKLITGITDFNKSLELSQMGDTKHVDMTVGDIYGGRDYAALNLNADMTASFFAKFINKDDASDAASHADICKGLLVMITNNIGQLANLNAQKYGIKNIFYAGNFLRGNEISMMALSEGNRFWSQGTTRALFLKHEGYFGAFGALIDGNINS